MCADLLLCSHTHHLGEMLLCLELHGLDEEPFPQEAETSSPKFSWKPAVEPYLQPQQKHRDFQAGYVQVAMILEHRVESTTAGGCPWVTVTWLLSPAKPPQSAKPH